MKYKCLSCNKVYWNKFNEELRRQFKITFKFTLMISTIFFLLLKNMFIVMSIWMNEKSLMNQHHLREKVLEQLKYGRCHRCRLYACKTSLHLKINALLLADVFKNFVLKNFFI